MKKVVWRTGMKKAKHDHLSCRGIIANTPLRSASDAITPKVEGERTRERERDIYITYR